MPTFKPRSCCNSKARALATKRSAALKKLSATPAGRKALQRQAKAAHQKSLAKKAAKAKHPSAKKVTGSKRPKTLPKPKVGGATAPPCKCGK